MAHKIKVIVKRPDEKDGHVTNISYTLENLQKTVEGHIETLTLPGFTIICNEEGIPLGLEEKLRGVEGRHRRKQRHAVLIVEGRENIAKYLS